MFIIARTNSSSCTWQSNLDFLCQAFAALQLNIKSGWVFIVANIQKGLWQSLNNHETRRRFSWIHSPLIASLSCIYRKGKRRESLKIFDSSNGLFPLYNPPRDKISIIFLFISSRPQQHKRIAMLFRLFRPLCTTVCNIFSLRVSPIFLLSFPRRCSSCALVL